MRRSAEYSKRDLAGLLVEREYLKEQIFARFWRMQQIEGLLLIAVAHPVPRPVAGRCRRRPQGPHCSAKTGAAKLFLLMEI